MSEKLVAEIVHVHITRSWFCDTERWYPETNCWCYMDKLVETLEIMHKALGVHDRLDVRVRTESEAWKQYNMMPNKETWVR